jgi:lipid-A-disaccharide synthase
MVIAGETSGDLLASELVQALPEELANLEAIPTSDYQPLRTSLEPRCFGAGGPAMAAAGVELAFDLTAHSVIGLSDVLKKYREFRRLFHQLYRLALEREPDVIVCVDFSGFNRRFAKAIRSYIRSRRDWFHDWDPKIVQYVSPQVWASRESRAYQIARDYDLLLSIFPFEKEWYAKRVPQLRVEFVGHPMFDRYPPRDRLTDSSGPGHSPAAPLVVLLPGSRPGELSRHLPVMLGAWDKIRAATPNLRALMVLPNDALVRQASAAGLPPGLDCRLGGLPEALREADLAIASTGTVTMECAWFGVPTIAMYRTSWLTYQIGKQIVTVDYLGMPNLLAKEEVFPEFIQDAATPENIAEAALALLRDPQRRQQIKTTLAQVIGSLGEPGASRRAAAALVRLLEPETRPQTAVASANNGKPFPDNPPG